MCITKLDRILVTVKMGTIRILVRRADNQAPLADAAVSLTAPIVLTRTTGADGVADLPVSTVDTYNFQVSADGFIPYSASVRVNDLTIVTRVIPDILLSSVPPAPIPPTLPPRPGEPVALPANHEVIWTIGKRCDLLRNSTFGPSFFAYRDRYTSGISNYRSSWQEAERDANKDPNCFLPPPPTVKEWQDGIQSSINTGFTQIIKYVTDTYKSVTGTPGPAGAQGPPGPPGKDADVTQERNERIAETTSLKASISDIIASITKVESSIKTGLDGIWPKIDQKLLDMDKMVKASLDGIWLKLETWLVDNLLRILEKALDAEVVKKE